MLQISRSRQRRDEFPESFLTDLFDGRQPAGRHQRFIVGYRRDESVLQRPRGGADFSNGTRGETRERCSGGFVSKRFARRVLAALGERIEHGRLRVRRCRGDKAENAGEL